MILFETGSIARFGSFGIFGIIFFSQQSAAWKINCMSALEQHRDQDAILASARRWQCIWKDEIVVKGYLLPNKANKPSGINKKLLCRAKNGVRVAKSVYNLSKL